MAQDRATPEKKLLELIESPSDGALREVKKKRKRIGFVSLGALKGRLSFLKGWIGKGFAGSKLVLDIKEINIILAVCVFGLVAFLAISSKNAINRLKNIPLIASEITQNEKVRPFSLVSMLKNRSYYSQKVNDRDVFKLGLKTTSQGGENGSVPEEKIITPKDELVKLVENLVLVGVSWSDNPVAMIEDKEAKITFFKKKDEEIKKDIKIKQILIDRVILEYKEAEVELKL